MKRQSVVLYSFLLVGSLFINSGLYAQMLPTGQSNLFAGAGICAQCHISGTGVLTTHTGTDISPTSLWRSTMMAHSGKDPLWQAKVSAEVSAHPSFQSVIEDKCTTCHMPMGRTEAIRNGTNYFSMDEGLADPISMDGVSCTLCHQIQDVDANDESFFSGGYEILNTHEIFGPYESPTTMPMLNQAGYTPVHADHVNDSELCATCHTLFTPYIDNVGNIGGYLPEQTPYLEWKNSIYPSDSIECQTCHMPATEEAMLISINPLWISTLRSPIWGHDFVGGNVFMSTILKQHGTDIGVTASSAQFDNTITKARHLLQEQSIDLSADVWIDADTLHVGVLVENLTGHKFPTGFPSRRAWLHVTIKDDSGNILFESGALNAAGEIIGLDDGFEPHHAVIHDPNQVQIYQSVMTNVANQVTYTLLRGAQYVKDNRIPPKGFSSSADGYESIAIFGQAAHDTDFNRDELQQEGSGSDRILYKYPLSGQGESLTIDVSMYYQTVAPLFIHDLFAYDTDAVNRFEGMYGTADNAPVLLKSLSLHMNTTGIKEDSDDPPGKFPLLGNYPNPFNPETTISFTLPDAGHVHMAIYNISGQKVRELSSRQYSAGKHDVVWDGCDSGGNPVGSGIYFARLSTNEKIAVLRMVLMR